MCKKPHCKCMNLNSNKRCMNHHYEDSCFKMVEVKQNYIEEVTEELATRIDVKKELLDLYALLVITRGVWTTLEDVHDAWAIWRTSSSREHKSIRPFESLSEEVQELDREYAEAIKATAMKINPRKIGF